MYMTRRSFDGDIWTINKPDTLFMHGYEDDEQYILPPLLTDLDYYYVNSMHPFSYSKYIINLKSYGNNKSLLSIPNRVVNLNLESAAIQCVKTNTYIKNRKRPCIRLPRSVRVINLYCTGLYRISVGYFIDIFVGYDCRYIQTRCFTESLIEISQERDFGRHIAYTPKSVRDLCVANYPTDTQVRQLGILDLAIYNLRYRIEKVIVNNDGYYFDLR